VVAMPAYSCYDLATAALGAGVDVSLYDVDPATLAPDERSLRRACAGGVCGVVLVHLYGYPVDVEAVRGLVASSGVLLIEDAAQALGAVVRGRSAGSMGDVTVLSFGRGKGVTAGHGGALLGARGDLAALAEALPVRSRTGALRDVTVLAAQWVLGRPRLYRLPFLLPGLRLGETVFLAPRPAAAASRAAPAALLRTLPLNAHDVARRRATARRLEACLAGHHRLRPIAVAAGSDPSYLRLPVRCPGDGAAGVQRSPRAIRLGIARGYPRSLADLDQLRGVLRNPDGRFSGARELAAQLCTLPTHRWVNEASISELEGWIRDAA
jgi:perosamine synthetase